MASIIYCGVCSIPPEYCEYGPQPAECKEWLKKTHPDLYSSLYEAIALEKKMKKLAVEGSGDEREDGSENDSDDDDEEGEDSEKKKPRKRGGKGLPKPKKPASSSGKKEVIITRKQRGGRKYVTVVSGLKSFDIDLKKAGKMFGTKFACGSSVTGDEITVQGDIGDELVPFLLDNFTMIDEADITVKEDKPKKKA